MNYRKVAEFLLNRSERWTITQANKQVISEWQELNLVSYNAAVKKLHKFKLSIGKYQYELPLNPNNIYQFVAWTGRSEDDDRLTKILATSLTKIEPFIPPFLETQAHKYLHGFKAWHTFHNPTYPVSTETRMKLMLKASGQQDAWLPPKLGKALVLIRDLLNLYWFLSGQGPESEVKGPIPFKSRMTVADVKRYKIATTLTLHEAKTATPGKTQLLKLRPMKGPLCPASSPTDSLFGYGKGTHRTHLTKRRTNEILRKAWTDLGRPQLSAHSFRVGGATLWNTSGVSTDKIKSLGRWTSECYQLYVKHLADKDVADSFRVLLIPSSI
ncbi:hypothetical protein PCASD_18459 [Puccinia coronata f. sp. avenae]|uniref:Tyr recombinase domain-containing protein n=1 Tax=Puccinia coronata f. sp. avenae TaxID=200324 RepID=A0A2N5U2W5_9BASI|nr:hypothetical protein PCASD_18459 [Puccinia coronata f. sp. avenae]